MTLQQCVRLFLATSLRAVHRHGPCHTHPQCSATSPFHPCTHHKSHVSSPWDTGYESRSPHVSLCRVCQPVTHRPPLCDSIAALSALRGVDYICVVHHRASQLTRCINGEEGREAEWGWCLGGLMRGEDREAEKEAAGEQVLIIVTRHFKVSHGCLSLCEGPTDLLIVIK